MRPRQFSCLSGTLCQELHQLGVHLLRMSPQHTVRAILQLHELDVLDQLRLSSGRSVRRKNPVGVPVQNECRDGVTSDVLTEVLDP